jgi:hypothetical protein
MAPPGGGIGIPPCGGIGGAPCGIGGGIEDDKALKAMIDRGNLGVKTGKGFYSYPDPEFRRPDFLMGKK